MVNSTNKLSDIYIRLSDRPNITYAINIPTRNITWADNKSINMSLKNINADVYIYYIPHFGYILTIAK